MCGLVNVGSDVVMVLIFDTIFMILEMSNRIRMVLMIWDRNCGIVVILNLMFMTLMFFG